MSLRLPNLFTICLTTLLLTSAAQAHEYTAGKLHIDHPWARATVPGAMSGAAYLTIENLGNQADALLSASTPVAAQTELHNHVMENDIVKMMGVAHIDIAAHGKTELKLGGYHVMLFGLKKELKAGDKFPLELIFKKAGKIRVEVKVESRAAQH